MNNKQSETEAAFEIACKYIKGDCPRVIHNVEPWDVGCNEYCSNVKSLEWKCWEMYFRLEATK